VSEDKARIAQLEAELGEMRAARDRFDRLARSHEAAHARTQASISAAMKKLEEELMTRAREALATMEDGAAKALAAVMRQRDTAQGAAAAMREKLQHLRPVVVDFYRELRRTEDQIEVACDWVSMGRRVEYLEDVLVSFRDRVFDSLQEYHDAIAALDEKGGG
jgi:predicted  nucleic acid-binding Zn-ribbon protein